MITLRSAVLEDVRQILSIYAYYVTHTAITFEYEVPTIKEYRGRMERILQKYPILVAEEEGTIIGFAYANVFKDRAAYDWSCETTIYLEHNHKRCGCGRMLYQALEEKLKAQGIKNMYACIGCPEKEDEYLTNDSPLFHEHMGFETVGTFHKCGYKFGRWYHMIWMEKMIGSHE